MNDPPRLLDQLRHQIRLRHYSYRTELTYIGWVKRFILFHDKKRPASMGGPEVEAWLSHLATVRNVAAATQAQALAAVLFLYKQVLRVELPWLDNVVRASQPRRVPGVVAPAQSLAGLGALQGRALLCAGRPDRARA